jgi:hypothetical protein
MMTYYHYWQSIRQFEESAKTVVAMMPDVPPMVQAQHEMNELQMDHFREESGKLSFRLLLLALVCVIIYSYI